MKRAGFTSVFEETLSWGDLKARFCENWFESEAVGDSIWVGF